MNIHQPNFYIEVSWNKLQVEHSSTELPLANRLLEIIPAKSNPPTQRNKNTYFKIVKITMEKKKNVGVNNFSNEICS
jgi:hypothetical protein